MNTVDIQETRIKPYHYTNTVNHKAITGRNEQDNYKISSKKLVINNLNVYGLNYQDME